MALPNRMPLRPGLLWLTQNLAQIIQCLVPLFPILRSLRYFRLPQIETSGFMTIAFPCVQCAPDVLPASDAITF
jgi:hypothetical protein